jgi:hypothetical protein
MDAIISFHSDFWECLKNEELIDYTDKIKSNKDKVFGIVEDESDSDDSKSAEEEETKLIEEFHNDTRVEMVTGKTMQKVQEDSV